MTTAFPPNTAAFNPTANADLDILTFLVNSNQPIYGAITARSYHSGGVNALFADGSVKFIKSTIDGNTSHPSGRSTGVRSSAATPIESGLDRGLPRAQVIREEFLPSLAIFRAPSFSFHGPT